VVGICKTETDEDFERAGRDTALIGRGILEHDDLALLEEQSSLLGEEQVGALDDVLEVRLALGVEEAGDVGDVDSLGTTTAGNEEVGLVAEVSSVAEIRAIGNDRASCEEWCKQLRVLEQDEERNSQGNLTSWSSTRTR